MDRCVALRHCFASFARLHVNRWPKGPQAKGQKEVQQVSPQIKRTRTQARRVSEGAAPWTEWCPGAPSLRFGLVQECGNEKARRLKRNVIVVPLGWPGLTCRAHRPGTLEFLLFGW